LKGDGFSRDAKGIASIVLEGFAKLVFRQVIHRLRKQALSAVHIAAIEKAKGSRWALGSANRSRASPYLSYGAALAYTKRTSP
jgi:hypothetical protein